MLSRRYFDVVETSEMVCSSEFWLALLAECVGTMLLVMIGCGSGIPDMMTGTAPSTVQIALAAGLTVATIVTCMNNASGAHINPAVSLAMVVTRHIPPVKGFMYVLCQCLGAVLGITALRMVTPEKWLEGLGVTKVNGNLNVMNGLAIEGVITFVLVFTVYSVCDSNRMDLKGSGPLAIGLAVAACHVFAIQYTGSSMNPARSFGPALVGTSWEHHWVYWLGPISGGVLAGILYENLFKAHDRRDLNHEHFLLSQADSILGHKQLESL